MKSLAMDNLFFKSSKRLIKNSPENLQDLMVNAVRKIEFIQKEQRHQRSDLQDVRLMINKLLIDKHLQQQVDTYFEDNPEHELEDK